MFVRNATWNRVRGEFSEGEKAELRAAIETESICPPGLHITGARVRADLWEKLTAAIRRIEVGA